VTSLRALGPHAPSWPSARDRVNPWREHDACGVGFVAHSSGERSAHVVRHALQALARVAHRGAAATDHSGDGAGILTQIPARLLRREAARLGVPLASGRPVAVGTFFLPQRLPAQQGAMAIVEGVLAQEGLPLLGWRDVPVHRAALGPGARASCPAIRQVLLAAPTWADDEAAWERALYLARRTMERRLGGAGFPSAECFVCSLSCRTVVYKALLTGTDLARFFPDLAAPDYESAIAVFHQRYSTNTSSSWPLVQPFRLLAHNGEINTLWGNRNAMHAREPALAAGVWGRAVERLKPVIWSEGSDSASLDDAMELLVRSGRDPVHALMMLVPEAHEAAAGMEGALRGFYEFHECLIEPWDGPAALAFSDGLLAGAAVDRNGLRPCRYTITAGGLVVAGSEAGLVDVSPGDVIEAGRLGPGELLVVDTGRGAILRNAAAKHEVARRRPYARWAARSVRLLRPARPAATPPPELAADALPRPAGFGWSFEDLRYVLEPMAQTGQDPVWSMGDDTPIPPLAQRPPGVYAFFRQRFAQVTNPPIDPLREALVMSLRMYLGRRGSLLADRPGGLRLVRNEHPVLLEEEIATLRHVAGVPVKTVEAVWPVALGADGLAAGLDVLCAAVHRVVQRGAHVVVLSDRGAGQERAPIPMLLAVGAVHQDLLRHGLRTRVSVVAEAGDAWDVHHVAALIGYGAEAVHPWLALQVVQERAGEDGRQRFRSAAEKGLRKILCKMGISTLASYHGAQIFEALGLGAEVIERCFTGTVSPLGGLGFAEIAEDVLQRHRAAYGESAGQRALPDHGRVRYRREGEHHAWSPPVVRAMQQAVGEGTDAAFAAFASALMARPPATPRDLLAIRHRHAVPLDQVEPVEAIRHRFVSTAMSLGALSPEAHRTLAIAMNRIGAKSNSGEGGEDPDIYGEAPGGDRADNRVKQVASGRFGVTTQYLVRADELEIKIAQGSKPGEGGQLPGHKVTALIARLRHSVPGVSLISPPPHHDIYSIEDLAQLIHDLKQVNPRARVGVKLVAEAGVGRVAAGVAKAYADYVLVSGHNGGTGASPLTSIKHAGSPWEMGLAETQAMLIENGLRHRVEVRVDGSLRTGRDVVIAALLGAEAYGFGTAPLVALGCAMARQCHRNTCPTGVATQDPRLRAKFHGTAEQVIAYFTGVAEEVRRILAAMGARTIEEIVGHVEWLERVDRPEVPRAQMLDLSCILADPAGGRETQRSRSVPRNDRPGIESLDDAILRALAPRLAAGRRFGGTYDIGNHHLTVGARIAGHIAAGAGAGRGALKPGAVRLRFRGSAGQSFGAFAVGGMRLELEGQANDYVGKGLSGGEIALRPFGDAPYAAASQDHVILGNTVLYGATAGSLFAAGRAGDRFAVRNSGAVAVVEGAGSHCCEYMTGGVVVVLGATGSNLGAGMTNGVAYVLDETGDLERRTNLDMVQLCALTVPDERRLHGLVRKHAARTQSPRGRAILLAWDRYRLLFRKVVPRAPAEPGMLVPAEEVNASPATR
jgi:glutamate synthase (ferredoxin)